MTTFSPSPDNYHKLAHSLATFTSLTQIKTIFYDFSGILLKDDFVYLNSSAIKNNLSDKLFEDCSILPVSRDSQLWGAVICEALNISKKRLFLSRNYLESIMKEVFADDNLGQITVWEPLTSDQVSKIQSLRTFFKPTQDASILMENQLPLTAAIHPIATVEGHPVYNNEALHGITLAITYIRKNVQQPITLNDVAQNSFLSPSYLSRLFKKYLHVNFIEYVNNQKIALAQEKLALTLTPVHQVSLEVGFSQASYFAKIFKKQTGLTPSEFRQRNHTIQKIYTIPRELTWDNDSSIIDISKNYFHDRNINYNTDSTDGVTYVNQIGDLGDANGNRGWIYTVDGQQPVQAADEINVHDKSVVQWVYTNYSNS